MIKNWSVEQIKADLQRIRFVCTDPRMDGFVTWGCKQDLYRIKFYLEEQLKQCPTYSVEAEWLEDQRKEQVWKALNETNDR